MAIKSEIDTSMGERRECYTRLNNLEVSNHGAPAVALFRSYLSREAFEKGAHYVAEFTVEFEADVTGNLWEQAYAALAEQQAGEAA